MSKPIKNKKPSEYDYSGFYKLNFLECFALPGARNILSTSPRCSSSLMISSRAYSSKEQTYLQLLQVNFYNNSKHLAHVLMILLKFHEYRVAQFRAIGLCLKTDVHQTV